MATSGSKPPDASQIGDFLRRARERQGELSQEAAAQYVGVTARTMWGWEHGKGTPPAETFFRLVLRYDANVLELLAIRATPPKKTKGEAGGETGPSEEPERRRRTG